MYIKHKQVITERKTIMNQYTANCSITHPNSAIPRGPSRIEGTAQLLGLAHYKI